MRFVLISLIVSVVFGWGHVAEAKNETVAAACASLERPNIDCDCVANRVTVYEKVSPSPQARATIVQGYLHALGKPNNYLASYEALMSDPMSAVVAVEAFDTVGGQPSNVTDFEAGCVIANAAPIEIAPSFDHKSIDDYVAACTASTSDQRFCQCDANRKARHVSAIEFEAYFRSFSDYGDRDARSSDELAEARGKAMGISSEKFQELQASARAKMDATSDEDAQYCDALTWADETPGLSAERRRDAGFEPGLAARLAPNNASDSANKSRMAVARPADTAHGIVKQSCAAQGNTETYCDCYTQAFDTDVAKKVDDPEVALAWALLNSGGAGLSTAEYVSMTQSIPQSSHQAAGMLMIQTMELGDHCTQGQTTKAAGLQGTPKQRMMEICVEENSDEALCSCAIGKMETQFSPDDFELIVDIREAEHLGSDDALADVAEQRGLNRSEAEEALANNPAIIDGMMAMGASMMQCMGGIPDMSNLPGFPQ